VLKWALERMDGTAAAVDTPIGRVPAPGALDIDGLDVTADDLAKALAVHPQEWRGEIAQIEEWFDKLGDRLPSSLHDELEALKQRLA
jgi:phosphoenolpyruvate carboxykinase (GTP)